MLPPRRPGDLPVSSSTENIYESIRDHETYYGIKDDSLKRDIKLGTLSEAVAQEIFSPSSLDDDDAYAVVPDLMVPLDTFPSEKGAPVLPNKDKTKSLSKKNNGIIDESGYLLPEVDDDIDVSVFGLAFPSKRNSSTDQVSSFKVGKTTLLVDDSGYLVSRDREQHENDNSAPRPVGGLGNFSPRTDDIVKKKSSTYPTPLQNDAGMIRHTYFGYNDSTDDVHGSEDTQNAENREYCDINPDEGFPRPKMAQCQKYETIGDTLSPSSVVDGTGTLVPNEQEQSNKRPSLRSISMKRDSTGGRTRRVKLETGMVVGDDIASGVGSDDNGYTADDLQMQHSYLDLADVIHKLSVKDQEVGDSEQTKYSEITAEASTYDSKVNTVEGMDGTRLHDQMPGLVDDLGYLVLSTEEQSQSQVPVSPLVDDGGYLVPDIELVDMMIRQASQSATKNPQNPGLDDIQHSYFGLNDSVSGTEGNRRDGAGHDIAYSKIAPNADTSNKKKNVVYDSIDQHVPSSSDAADNAPEDLRHIYFDSADLVQQQRQGVSHQSEASGRREALGGGKTHTRPEEGNVQNNNLDQFGYLILDKT